MSFLFTMVLVFSASIAQGTELSTALKQRVLKKIEASGISQSQLGIYLTVNEQGSEQVVLDLNSEKPLIPASLSKIPTAGAALNLLGPSTTFKTQIVSSGTVADNVLKGNLVFKGGGDPGFVSESLWVLVNHFMRNKIHIIEGDLVVDDTLFDSVRKDPSRDTGRGDRAYDAPIGAASFNWNSINVYVRPGKKPGDKAIVFADPDSNYIRVENNVRTVGAKMKYKVNISRVKPKKAFHGEVVKLSGQVPVGYDEKVVYKSVLAPDKWTGYHLRAFLERRGIEITGTVKIGPAPLGAKVLAEVESKPVSAMVQDMMKFSNNFVAEMLTKQMAVSAKTVPGTMESGMEQIRSFVTRMGIQNLEMVNPSGLTTKNQFHTKSLHKLLVKVRQQYPIMPEFMSSYPVAGKDGTLKGRMKNTPGEGWVRAKTGMLSGVSGLAGYGGRKSGEPVVFAMIFNGVPGKWIQARDLFDDIAVELVK